MKIILFEGIDKVGKTTTIDTLFESFTSMGFVPMRMNVPFKSSNMCREEITFRLKMTIKNITEMNERFDDKHICLVDRLHLSEVVYGDVLRNGDYDKLTCSYVDFQMSKMDAMLIHIIPNSLQGNYQLFKDSKGLIDGLTFEQYSDTLVNFMTEVNRSEIRNKMELKTYELDDVLKITKFLGGL